MEAIELIDIIEKGENSTVQFKERVTDGYDISKELFAFSNSKGGLLIIGVNDKTKELRGLTYDELQATNNLLASVASDQVKSPIYLFTETVEINGNNLIVVSVNEGGNKPYMDRNGIIWVKNASDKRKVVSKEEISRLLQSGGNLMADEQPINNTSINNINMDLFTDFVHKKTEKTFEELNQSPSQILNNMGFAKDDTVTLAGLLLFGKNPQAFKPLFTVQCISFVGNEITGKEYRDNEPPFEGNLLSLYEKTMTFINRNLHKIQKEESFNSIGQLEIPKEALEELVVNSLIHRDYFLNATVKIFIFDNRIEIISPGKLPNSLTVEKIKSGTSNVRNPILFTNARYLLPFVGVGTGIPRAYATYPNIELNNLEEKDLFIAIINRPIIS